MSHPFGQLVEHEDGIYIGLAEERYHQDWAIGSNALKTIRHSPVRWWWKSPFNTIEPEVRDPDEAAHFRLGKAVHVAVLESMEVYERVYGVLPGRDQYPDALVTLDDLQKACRGLGLPHSGRTKPELTALLKLHRPGIQILDDIQAIWRLEGRREVSAAQDRRIRLIRRMIDRSEAIFKADGEDQQLRRLFEGGLSELSVFWTDQDGIRQRCRFDKIKARIIADLKTFGSWREDTDFDSGLIREIKQRQYPLQAAHYHEGRIQLRRLFLEGKVFGGNTDEHALLEKIAMSDVWGWLWVFAVTSGAPMVKGVRMPLDCMAFANAQRDRTDSLAQFMHYREFYGLEPGALWFDPASIITPGDDEFAVA